MAASFVIDLKDKPKLILLGGVPRSGKSLLCQKLWQENKIPGFSIDVMVATFMHLGAADVLNFNDSEDRTQKVAIAVDRVARTGLHLFGRYFVEGESITPAVADLLRSKYDVSACFMVMHDPRIADVIEHESHDPWVCDATAEQQETLRLELIRRSLRIQSEADKYAFVCIDMSAGDYRERAREVLRVYSEAGLTFSGSMP